MSYTEGFQSKDINQVCRVGQVLVATPVIPATWEAEIGRIEFPGQPGEVVHKTPSQPICESSGSHLSSQLCRRLGKIIVPGQLRKKLVRPHLNRKKLGVVAHICHPSDGERCEIGGFPSRPACTKKKNPSPK
jgi:hypothetical protein